MSDKDDDIIPGQSWIMCNICCRSASTSPPHIIFYLTKCGHIFCSKCLVSVASSQDMARICLYCKKEITLCRISRDMPQTAQTYFRCPRELLAESMVEVMQVIKFQAMHAACLVKRFNVMRISYEKLRQYCYDILQKKTALERELMKQVGFSQQNKRLVDDMSAPLLERSTSVMDLCPRRNIETSKKFLATENLSKSGTELSTIENSACLLAESVFILKNSDIKVTDVAKISVENPAASRISHTSPSA
uniref:RING-type domain-containing protein n=1 Tax=Setaria digitata TaxID=48799 RepID=A0A915PLH9_9BILA